MTERARRVVLASANAGKQREFAALLSAQGIDLVLQSALGIASVEESGSTFEANALLKARHAARLSGLAALADDSGLEVDALRGRPGVHSARYALDSASDESNNAKLLAELAGVPPPARTARYRCVLILARSPDDPTPLLASGSWEGSIALQPAGAGGFGYDPLFVPHGFEQSAAQLPAELKNRLSHRGQALSQLIRQLQHTPW
ncbi:MAG TPA: RdgB/HAM1 family non-canonical purine NTP pyrophosphatase [Steroidobacteraceae bacterium]|nr:RdgB/HAM1 family non-canonical purine NTP pyrophosphatase [Steroidobacteraceae bacterium]